MSLANKYRPQTFDTVIWQNHITEILKAQMASDKKIHHNYILFWPRWTGKTTAARILAKAINCLDLQDGNPCNKCTNCQTINEWKTMDYIEIDAASHTWVDNVREEIIDKALYPPISLKKKIYVIDEVHMLSKQAFNALLKTIEEPKSSVCFILATTLIDKVPETILSRCQVFNFKKIPSNKMIPHLENICQQEEIKYSEEALEIIAKMSEWCVRDAIKYVDQISVLWDINEVHITKFLWVAPEAFIQDFLNLIKDQDPKKIFDKIDEIYNQWIDLHNFAKQILMNIDQHFLDDIEFLSRISEAFTEIISTMRYYPYPAIAYKIAINKHLNKSGGNDPEKKKINSDSSDDNIATQEISNESQNILNQLLSQIERPSLKNSLKDHIIIDKIEDNLATIIVINKMTHLTLEKRENLDYLEEALSKILGKDTKIKLIFENKETYFANKLG